MNERIRELARRVVGKNKNDVGSISLFDEQIDQFAKLIVQECSLIPDWCIETGGDQFVETCMAERTSKMIKQHFGVNDEAI
jgi:hypothetical protein